MADLTPEEELEAKRKADAEFAASQGSSPLAILQAEPGQVGGVNQMDRAPMGGLALGDRNALLAGQPISSLPPSEDTFKGPQDAPTAPAAAEPGALPAPIAPPPSPSPSVDPAVRKPAKTAGGGLPANPFAKTKDEALAEGAQGVALDAAGGAITEKTNAAVEAAQDEVKGKQDAQKIIDQHAEQERQRRQAIADKEKAYADFSAKRREEIQKKDLTGYWEDKSTGSKILAALSVGLGGFASGLTGGPNQALAIIQHSMAADAALKEKKLRAHLDSLGLDDKAYEHQLELGRAEIGIDHEGMLEKLKNDADIRAAKAKVPEAQANGAAMAAGLEQERAKQAQANADRGRAIIGQTVDYGMKRAELGIRGAEASANSKLKDAEIRHLDAESASLGAKGSAVNDPLTMLGSNGKPAAYKDETGTVTPIRARSPKSAEELSNYATKAPTLDRSLKRLSEIATGPESERLRAIASGEVGRLRSLVVDAGAVLDSTSGKTSVALINLNREKVSDEKYFNGLKDPGKLFANAREAARQGYADALVAHTNIPRAHSGRFVNDLLGREANDTGMGPQRLSSPQIAALRMEIQRNGPRAAEARAALQQNSANGSP